MWSKFATAVAPALACLCFVVCDWGEALVTVDEGAERDPQAALSAPPPRAIRTDSDGDRLPPDAIARIGSTRFRHPQSVLHCAYSADGKTLVTVAGDGVFLWNADTGKLVRKFVRDGADFTRVALTPDGKTLFALSDLKDKGGELFALDPATGEDRRRQTFPELFFDTATFSPDASRLAATTTDVSSVELVNCTTGKTIARIARVRRPVVDQPPVRHSASFTNDGKQVVVVTMHNPARLFDAATGKYLKDLSRVAPVRALALPDGGVVWGGMWATARQDAGEEENWQRDDVSPYVGLLLSPDGTKVVAMSQTAFSILDAKTGKTLHSGRFQHNHNGVAGTSRFGRDMIIDGVTSAAFRPDGKVLAVTSFAGTVVLWDVATGRSLPQSADPPAEVFHVMFTHGGRRLGVMCGRRWTTWDLGPNAGAPTVLTASETLSPDGTIWLPYHGQKPTAFLDAATAKPLQPLSDLGERDHVNGDFSADGKRFIGTISRAPTGGGSYEPAGTGVWDVASGKRIAIRHDTPGALALAPDGKLAILGVPVADPNDMFKARMEAWEPDTDRIRWTRDKPAGPVAFVAAGTKILLRDGRSGYYLAPNEVPPAHDPFIVLDAASGRDVTRIAGPPLEVVPAVPNAPAHTEYQQWVAAPDGRTVALTGDDGIIRLWDLLADGERYRFAQGRAVRSFAFSPDGRTLAAASYDAPVLLWDVYGLQTGATAPDAAALAKAWDDLASPNAGTGFRAVRAFAASGATGLDVLRSGLAKVKLPDAKRVEGWIRDLSAADFKTREAASDELARIARIVRPRLTRAARETDSPEAAQRINVLLNKARKPAAEELRASRSVEIAELLATPEAIKLLTAWAADRGEILAEEAKAALTRLGK